MDAVLRILLATNLQVGVQADSFPILMRPQVHIKRNFVIAIKGHYRIGTLDFDFTAMHLHEIDRI